MSDNYKGQTSLPPPRPDSTALIYNTSFDDATANVSSSGSVDDGFYNNNNESYSKVPVPEKLSGVFGATSNLVNIIVGAGVIGVPYSFRESGMVTAVLLLLLVAWMTDKGLRMLIELAYFHPRLRKAGVFTYEDLMSIPFGEGGRVFALLCQYFGAYGVSIAYLIIIKDTVPNVLNKIYTTTTGEGGGGGGGFNRELVMFLTSLVIILPLSCLRDLANLSFTSLLSVLADAVIVVFIIVYAPIQESVSERGGFGVVLRDSIISPRLFVGLGIISTAMACNQMAFNVSLSLRDLSSKRWHTVAAMGVYISVSICIVMGLAGYLGFLDSTQANVLNNFDPQSLTANVARGLLAVSMVFTYPMEAFVQRSVILQLLYRNDPDRPEICCVNRLARVTLFIYLSTLIPALLIDDLGHLLSITGAIGVSFLSYIGPGMIYLGIHGEAFLHSVTESIQKSRKKKHAVATSSGDDDESSAILMTETTTIIKRMEIVKTSNGTANNGNDKQQSGESSSPQSSPSPSAGISNYPQGPKPWWWYLGLYPIWCTIAHRGSVRTNQVLQPFLEQSNKHGGGGGNPPNNNNVSDEIIGPRQRDFYISIFFIVFGFTAAIVGLVTNILDITREITTDDWRSELYKFSQTEHGWSWLK